MSSNTSEQEIAPPTDEKTITPPKREPTPPSMASRYLPTAKLTSLARFALPSKEPPPVFPPPSWGLGESKDNGAGASSWNALLERLQAAVEAPAPVEVPEPVSFAQKLRGLISTLPLPGYGPTTEPGDKKQDDASKDPRPVPEGVDAKLMRQLSSEDVMNGSRGGPEGARESVWSALDGLGHNGEQQDESVMMYVPLEPTKDSKVELAESEIEYVDEESPLPEAGTDKGKGKQRDTTPEKPNAASSTSAEPLLKAEPQKHIRWVPSTTKISLQATWWGYRIYLPPPVMAVLDNTQLKATQRGALIAAALKWFLDRVPMMLIPIQFRPAVLMLRRLTPIIGIIGVFVGWSWGRVGQVDKGNGVVLTATWLLPVALVPMSWDAGDIYGPTVAPIEDAPNEPPQPSTTSTLKAMFMPSEKGKTNGKTKEK